MGPEMGLLNEEKWQQGLGKRNHARALVRGLLGCTCPEEIFDHYQVRQQMAASLPMVELIMGDRLLVWIIDGNRVIDAEQTFVQLLKAGKEKRDNRGLNRFRLVVVGDFSSWEKEFGHLAETLGPKVHLHALPEVMQEWQS